MTISTEAAALSYNGDGATTAFSITWVYFAKADVVATHRSSAGVETIWVLDTDYTLTTAGVSSGGTLTATTAPATGETLVITLEPANTQTKSLPLGGPFPSPSVEDGLDLAAQRDSKLQDILNRALLVPKTDTQTVSLLDLPIDSSRADKFLSFDSNGKPIAAAGTSANLGPVSAFIDTLLDDADPGTAMATLFVKGADIASAATLVVGTDGNYLDVTGTTGITAMTVAAGRFFILQFDGAVTLTHHATNLNLPGGVDFTTVAGERLICFSTAANQVHVISISGSGPRGAAVRKSASQSIPDSANTFLTFDTEDFDTDSIHDTVTNNSRLTVPSGIPYVKVAATVQFNNNVTGQRSIEITQNTSTGGILPAAAINAVGGSFNSDINIASGLIPVSPGDYFEVRVFQNSGGALNVNFGRTEFSIELLT